MSEIPDMIDSHRTVMYPFRFGTSDKLVHLTQEQLDRIPYLSTLVSHKDDFLSIQNENNEYVLNPPIHYSWFMAILHSITSEQPYILFNELPVQDNILDLLQLFDYLGIKSFSLPFLKDVCLTRVNPINEDNQKECVEYHRANVSEARQTAAEFIIAFGKNEYDFNVSTTADSIFSLVMAIFSNESIFSSRFRHHTSTILRESCHLFFSKWQLSQLPTKKRIARSSKIDLFLCTDDEPLAGNFQNTFAWRGVYMTKKEIHIDWSSTNFEAISFSSLFLDDWYGFPDRSIIWYAQAISRFEISPMYLHHIPIDFEAYLNPRLINYEAEQRRTKEEAQSARLGHFNTLPKKPKVDKFKHRSGPKAQKHR